MSCFKWSACAGSEEGYKVVLKDKEEDFIVREGITDKDVLLGINSLVDNRLMYILNTIPAVNEDLLIDYSKIGENKIARVIRGIVRVCGVEEKNDRRKIHKLYSSHPFMYTKPVINEDGTTDILVVYDTHHTNHVYSVTLTKKGRTTQDAISILSKQLKVPGTAIKFSGTKDKRGITTQQISIEGVSFIDLYHVCNKINTSMITEDTSENKEDTEENKEDTIENKKKIEECITVIPMKIAPIKEDKVSCRVIKSIHLLDNNATKVSFKEIEAHVNECLEAIEEYYSEEQTDQEYLSRLLDLKTEIHLGQIKRIENTLKLGDLSRNRFYLTMATEEREEKIDHSINELARIGFPNYYGSQRFGYNMINPTVGKHIIHREYNEALTAILTSLEAFAQTEKVQQALSYIKKNQMKEAYEILPGKYQTEKSILRGLSRRMPARAIITNQMRRETRTMYIHSYQSMLFNDMLNDRLVKGFNQEEYVADDLWIGSITNKTEIQKHIKVANNPSPTEVFLPLFPKPEANKPSILQKVPGGKGGKMQYPNGGYRKALILPKNIKHTLSNGKLSLSFDLPPGTYGTMVVKEITKNMCQEVTGRE
ncbi:tRNA pseudouridine13 synthase [Nematocida sp. AWRm80]|nr:tRNA pseudouridine13 synthase [Nematocida sp. AWRm80]